MLLHKIQANLIHSQNRKTKGKLHMTTSDKELYKCWASLKEDRVVGIVSMRAPAHIDFSDYRAKAVSRLESLGGRVKGGKVVERDGQVFFIKRPTHENRNKHPRPVTYYPIKEEWLA